jgi:DNA polymerase I-like protein with 3'-5' exonuclease and polymerase domains
MASVAVVDFETDAITHAPAWLPPRPVGVAIRTPQGSTYYAWGHPTGNNCTQGQAVQALAAVWDGEMVFHNAAFDVSVAVTHLGLPWPKDPTKVHDTMYLLFLEDPYSKTFSLKPSAERYLGLAPVERDAVREWVLAHVPGATAKNWGAHIGKAPGELVGNYAVGDVDRTWLLFDLLHHKIINEGMQPAYQREQRLMPILSASTKRGINLDADKLEEHEHTFEIALTRSTNMIYRLLGAEINIDSDQELVAALEQADAVQEWFYTDKGNKSVSRKNLSLKPEFAELRNLLDYRGMLNTCITTFVRPWLLQSKIDGKLHPEWNQTRGERSKVEPQGTRTGRLSSANPNFQNVPNASGINIPRGLPPLPRMREYIMPPEGHVWLKRDFSAQEMRIMAHFAEGKLYDAFRQDPSVDPHKMVQGIIKDLLGLDLPRKHIKVTGFGIMYGMGIQKLADQLEIAYEEGQLTKNAYFTALPEVKQLAGAVKRKGSLGQAITTWGGRRYFREENERDLSYKLLNYLIQGSAADQTKQSIIDWHENKHPDDVFLATVHDENNVSAPIEDKAPAMQRLRLSMDKDRFDVPFLSEGFAGPNWGDLEEYEA